MTARGAAEQPEEGRREFLTERTTIASELLKRTTSRMKCQNYRGGRLPRRHVSPAATVKGGTLLHRFFHQPERGTEFAGPAACERGGTLNRAVTPVCGVFLADRSYVDIRYVWSRAMRVSVFSSRPIIDIQYV